MSVTEIRTVDMAEVLTSAYELGDMINNSIEVANYLYWEERMLAHPEVISLMHKLNSKKELFEETQRFGHFHPNFHEAKEQVEAVQREMEQIEAVWRFKDAEEKLDQMLYEMSELIAHSVSESIKVPSNNPLPKGGGCGSGGSCGCS
ncbi:YlbF family regulator [Paenibacillus sp. PsM32]|uniref:YlbF family regulator n=1 Tax=Paenibacillus kyungheensis TaxID=1452732 RepID=A0AAX3LX02_9BACL|nr:MULTISPECIES: YlbF family regulator [Paenibacillus]MDN4619556.1 YlbF family regulator [Paenibacillus sp. PsM32]WCT54504.1 YlbF family regulator [Paenibacillus kyungheensis]WDF52370.1 YlbF family regulator [Paenibacillus sp. KACC 21273]